jgi:predicted RNA-binding Zn ribbon-like protein
MTSPAGEMHLVGGNPALDFANTIGDGRERLLDAGDVLDWAIKAGITDRAAAANHRHDLEADEKRAQKLLRDVQNVREVLRTIAVPLAKSEQPEQAALAKLRDLTAQVVKDVEFRPAPSGGYGLSFQNAPVETALLGPVIWSAVEMLEAGQFERLKQCPQCAFLFLDRSKNNSRRWCDMATCGNRTKLRNFRQRRR